MCIFPPLFDDCVLFVPLFALVLVVLMGIVINYYFLTVKVAGTWGAGDTDFINFYISVLFDQTGLSTVCCGSRFKIFLVICDNGKSCSVSFKMKAISFQSM